MNINKDINIKMIREMIEEMMQHMTIKTLLNFSQTSKRNYDIVNDRVKNNTCNNTYFESYIIYNQN